MLKRVTLVFRAFLSWKALVILGLLFTSFLIKNTHADSSNILINEILANPLTTDEKEWVEIYNNSESSIDLTGWLISENTSSDQVVFHNFSKTVLDKKSSCFFEFSSSLNNDKDTVAIYNSDGTKIDTYSYTNSIKGKSFSRVPDGGSWSSNLDPTKTQNCTDLVILPTLTPTPILQQITVTPTPTATPTPIKIEVINDFIISKNENEIFDDQELKISVSLTLSNFLNKKFYLKAAFKKVDGSNYFGLTKNGNEWIKNNEEFSKQFSITTDESGKWQNDLIAKIDTLDSGYVGTGEYLVKVGRYSLTGILTWSNELGIKITKKESESNFLPIITLDEEVESTPSPSQKVTRKISEIDKSLDILGEASESKNYSITKRDRNIIRTLFFILIGLLLVGFACYWVLKKGHNLFVFKFKKD